MATDVTMPRLSDSMEEGTVLKWLVEEGGEVKRGEPLVEIETDKANMTYEADTDGVLVEIVAKRATRLPVGEVIARIGEAGEAPAGDEAEGEERRARGGAEPQAEPEPEAEQRGDGDEPQPRAAAAASLRRQRRGDGERVKASPVARRMASELGVELAGARGLRPGRADREGGRRGGRRAAATRRPPSGRAREEPRASRPSRGPSRRAARPAPRARCEVARAHPPPADGDAAHGGVEGHRAGLRARRWTWT